MFFILLNAIENERYFSVLFVMIALFYGLLNTTRIPESDLLRYKEIFDSASVYPITQYLAGYGEEIVFYLFTFFLNRLLFGNFQLYILFVTFIQYYLIFLASKKLFQRSSKSILLLAIALFFLDSRIFFSSAHLLRQMVASSIFIYYLAEKFASGKENWWLIPIAVLIHSSSGLLFLICFIPKLSERMNPRLMLILVIFVVLSALWGSQVIALLQIVTRPISWLNYPLERLGKLDLSEYSWYDGSGVNSVRISLTRYVLVPLFVTYILGGLEKKQHYIVNFGFLFFFVLEYFVASHLTYMQLRMGYYLHAFSSIAMAFMVSAIWKKYGQSLAVTVSILLICFFGFRYFRSYTSTQFSIIPFEEMITKPLVLYIANLF